MEKNKVGKFIVNVNILDAWAIRFLVPVFLLFFCLVLPNTSLAQVILPDPLGGSTFAIVIQNVLDYIRTIIGVLAILMFVWAGILFISSAGNESRLSQAKKVAWYAVVGLAIGLAGTALVELIQSILGVTPPVGP